MSGCLAPTRRTSSRRSPYRLERWPSRSSRHARCFASELRGDAVLVARRRFRRHDHVMRERGLRFSFNLKNRRPLSILREYLNWFRFLDLNQFAVKKKEG